LRTALFNAAFVARQRDAELRQFMTKKLQEGKHYLVAMIAHERKLVHRIWAVWTRGTPYVERSHTHDEVNATREEILVNAERS
jgi:hypothetical protein